MERYLVIRHARQRYAAYKPIPENSFLQGCSHTCLSRTLVSKKDADALIKARATGNYRVDYLDYTTNHHNNTVKQIVN